MKNLTTLDWIALTLVLVGGLNWGLIGLLDFNLVSTLFGDMSALSRVVYSLVGLSTLYVASIAPKLGRK
ncbi:MAG: DUF378 domain-containing protein [bacterium]|nr:DUF378 domain-containing protein [bacterium]